MRSIVMTGPGSADEVLHLTDLPEPQIQSPHEIRVRIKAAGINPVDTKMRRSGGYYPGSDPIILGCDAAGVVDAIGDHVTLFEPGDGVMFFNGGMGRADGNYRELTVVHEDYVVAKPASLDFAHAAALPLVFITAWEALIDQAGLTAGQECLIHAGAGGVGHIALQLARHHGARIATTVSPDRADFCQQMGAELCIDYHATDFVEAITQWTEQRGVDVVFDTVGGKTLNKSVQAAALYGDVVTLLEPDAQFDWQTARLQNLRISLVLMLSPMYLENHAARCHQTQILQQAVELVDAGKLHVEVADVLPLEQAAQAHRLIESGHIKGKLVLSLE